MALSSRPQARRPSGRGWSFDVVHLHAKSGSLSPVKHFAYDLRQIVRRQTSPGYELIITQDPNGAERLNLHLLRSTRSQSGCRKARARYLTQGKSWNSCSCYRGPQLSCHRGPDPRAIGDQNRTQRLGAQHLLDLVTLLRESFESFLTTSTAGMRCQQDSCRPNSGATTRTAPPPSGLRSSIPVSRVRLCVPTRPTLTWSRK